MGWKDGRAEEKGKGHVSCLPGVQSSGEKLVSKMGHIPEVTRYQVIME